MKKYLCALLLASSSAVAQIAVAPIVVVKYSTCIYFTQADVPITTSPLSARASSGVPVTFASKTPTVCTVAGGIATLKLAGLCTIVAKSAATPAYMAGQTPLSFNVTAVLGPPPMLPLSIKILTPVAGEVFVVGKPINVTTEISGAPVLAELIACGSSVAVINKPPWAFSWAPIAENAACSIRVYIDDGQRTANSALFDIKINASDVLPPPALTSWTEQEKFFAACGPCPSTGKVETESCAEYTIRSLDDQKCVESAKCKWVRKL